VVELILRKERIGMLKTFVRFIRSDFRLGFYVVL